MKTCMLAVSWTAKVLVQPLQGSPAGSYSIVQHSYAHHFCGRYARATSIQPGPNEASCELVHPAA